MKLFTFILLDVISCQVLQPLMLERKEISLEVSNSSIIQTGPDTVIENATGIGRWGGSCTCPSGAVYQVGDNGDNCGSLACVDGQSGQCTQSDGVWSRRKVVCADPALCSQEECAIAGKVARENAGQSFRRGMQIGTWGYVPYGCSVQSRGDWATHWNKMTSGKNDGSYTALKCSPRPCDNTAAYSSSCCTARSCGLGEGDCDEDNECQGNLICGTNNCGIAGWPSGADCCTTPPVTCQKCQQVMIDSTCEYLRTEFLSSSIFSQKYYYSKSSGEDFNEASQSMANSNSYAVSAEVGGEFGGFSANVKASYSEAAAAERATSSASSVIYENVLETKTTNSNETLFSPGRSQIFLNIEKNVFVNGKSFKEVERHLFESIKSDAEVPVAVIDARCKAIMESNRYPANKIICEAGHCRYNGPAILFCKQPIDVIVPC